VNVSLLFLRKELRETLKDIGIGIFGKGLTLSMIAAAVACLIASLLALFLLRLNLKNFQREEILTKWK